MHDHPWPVEGEPSRAWGITKGPAPSGYVGWGSRAPHAVDRPVGPSIIAGVIVMHASTGYVVNAGWHYERPPRRSLPSARS